MEKKKLKSSPVSRYRKTFEDLPKVEGEEEVKIPLKYYLALIGSTLGIVIIIALFVTYSDTCEFVCDENASVEMTIIGELGTQKWMVDYNACETLAEDLDFISKKNNVTDVVLGEVTNEVLVCK